MTTLGGTAHQSTELQSCVVVAGFALGSSLCQGAKSEMNPHVFPAQVWSHELSCLLDGVEKLRGDGKVVAIIAILL